MLATFRKIKLYFNYSIARAAPTNALRLSGLKRIPYVSIGSECYLGPNMTITPFGGDIYKKSSKQDIILLKIEDRVAIGPNVTFLCSMHPGNSKLSILYGKTEQIVIGNDAWIGAGAIIMGGVKVNKYSIVGAGAVVTKDVPEGTVVAGVPAKSIKQLDIDGYE